MNAKIITSLLAIVAVGAAAIGGTYAWFSSQQSSTGNTFSSGSVALKLANINSANWEDTVAATWDFTNMAPGGAPQESTLRLENQGTVKTESIDLSLAKADDGGSGIEKQLRITKLTLDGVNVLKGGAGADQSNYAKPTVCDYNVNTGTSAYSTINSALSVATTGQVICVAPGNYSSTYEGTPLNVSKSVTLVSLQGPANTTISDSNTSAGITISAANVTIKGFTIAPDKSFLGNAAAIMVNGGGATIRDNIISGISGDGLGTIKGIHAFNASTTSFGNLTITNNIIQNVVNIGKGADGIMIQGNVSSSNITHNTITNISSSHTGSAWDYALGIEDTPTGSLPNVSPAGLIITDNHIENVASVTEPGRGFSVDEANHTDYADATQVTFAKNDIVNVPNQITNKDQASAHTLNAENNWFGSFTPTVNANGAAKDEIGKIDTTNFAGNAFVGFVNGVDGADGNGYADMQDLRLNPIIGFPFELVPNVEKQLVMDVQLDGPTTDNSFEGKTLTTDVVVNIK